jgi:4-amino-4-deoxy-L-arabinose transferase-like glycosyltransferase
MPKKKRPNEAKRANPTLVLLLFGSLLLTSSLLLFWNLQKPPFTDYDEGIYAEVLASTVQHHSFFVLYDQGQPWFHKPPLYFWLALETDKVLRYPGLSYRLPAAVLGLIGIILVTAIVFELSANPYTAVLAGFILAGTGDFIESARQLRIEAGVIAAVLFTFYCYLRAKKDKRWLMGILAGVAIGIMFKSIIGTLGLCVILIFSLFDRDFSWLKSKFFWIGGVLGFLILAPWHLYETYLFGFTFWQDYLFHQVLQRFVSNVNGGGHQSNWLYVRDTFLYAFPWSVAFLAGILSLFWKKFLGERYRVMLALLGSVCFIFLIFLIAQTKITYYVLPGVVFFSIISALLFERWYANCRTVLQKRFFWVALIGIVLLGLANSVYVGFHYQPDFSGPQTIVYEEHAIGVVLASQPSLPIGAFYYPDWDTIRYYSDDKDSFTLIQSGYSTTSPMYMLMVTSLYKSQPFGSAVMAELKPLYVGTWLTLLRFNPSKN